MFRSRGVFGRNVVRRRRGSLVHPLIAALVLSAGGRAVAQEPIVTLLAPGEERKVWDGWNVEGEIFVSVEGGGGQDCVKLRWRHAKLSLGSSWTACDRSTVVAPALSWLFVELMAGAAERPVAIAVTDNVSAGMIELCGRFVEC